MSNRIVQLTDAAGNNAYPITYANNILDSSGSPIGGFATDEMISDQYDSTREGYSEGDYCIYQDTLYRCIRSTPASPSGVGEFNSAYWKAIRLADAVASNKSAITSEIESDQYYDKNEYAFHNDDLYKCTSDDTLGWNNGSGWSSTTVGDELTSLKSDLSKSITFTESSGTTLTNSCIGCTGSCVSGTIEIQCSASITTWVTIGSISKPPTSQIIVPAVRTGNGSFVGMVRIKTNGTVDLYSTQSLSNNAISFTFGYGI